MSLFSINQSQPIFPSNPSIKQNSPKVTPAQQKELDKLKNACGEFESIFVYQMMKEMRKSVHKTGLIHGGQAETIFRDMLDQEQSKSVSIGIGSMLYQQLSKSIVPPKR